MCSAAPWHKVSSLTNFKQTWIQRLQFHIHTYICIHMSPFSARDLWKPPPAMWLKIIFFFCHFSWTKKKPKQFPQFNQISMILSFTKVVRCLIYGNKYSNVLSVYTSFRMLYQQHKNIEFDLKRLRRREAEIVFTSSSVYPAANFFIAWTRLKPQFFDTSNFNQFYVTVTVAWSQFINVLCACVCARAQDFKPWHHSCFNDIFCCCMMSPGIV